MPYIQVHFTVNASSNIIIILFSKKVNGQKLTIYSITSLIRQTTEEAYDKKTSNNFLHFHYITVFEKMQV